MFPFARDYRTAHVTLDSRRARSLVTLAGSALVLLALAGCGTDETDSSSTDSHVQAAAATPVTTQSNAVARQAGGGSSSQVAASAASDSGYAPPPELELAGPDSVVAPGDVIEVTAQATPDAEQLVIWDGVGDHEAMTYDADARVWRARVRLPLRPRTDRVAISVTAYDGSRHWRRRWLFVNVGGRPESAAQPAGADSTR